MEATAQTQTATSPLRRWLWIAIILSAAALAGLVGWYYWLRTPKGWSQLIPGDALVIVRINQPSQNWYRWKQNPALSPVLSSELLSQVEEPFMAAKLTLKKAGLLDEADKNLKLILSLHPAGQESRALVLIPVEKAILQPYQKKALTALVKDGWKPIIRNFKGEALVELKHPRLGKFAMALLDQGWVGSRYPELIEDCIRRTKNDFPALPNLDPTEALAPSDSPWLVLTAKGLTYLGENLGLPTHYNQWLGQNSQIFAGTVGLPLGKTSRSWTYKGRWMATDSADIQNAVLPEGTPFDWMAHIPTETAIAQIWHLPLDPSAPPLVGKNSPTSSTWQALKASLNPQWIALQIEPFAYGENLQALLIAAKDSSRVTSLLQSLDPNQKPESKTLAVYTLADASLSAWLTAAPFDLGKGPMYAAMAKGYLLLTKDRISFDRIRQAIYERDTWASLKSKPQIDPAALWHVIARPDYCQLLTGKTADSASLCQWQNIAKSHDWLYLSGNSHAFDFQMQVKSTTQQWQSLHWSQTDTLIRFDQRPTLSPFLRYNPSTSKQEVWAQIAANQFAVVPVGNSIKSQWTLPFMPDDKPTVWQNAIGATYYAFWKGRKIRIGAPADTSIHKDWSFPGQTGKITYIQPLAWKEIDGSNSMKLLVGKSDTLPLLLDPIKGIWQSCFQSQIKDMMPEPPACLTVAGQTIGLFATHTGSIWALNLATQETLPGFPIQMPDKVLSPIFAFAGPDYRQSQFQITTRLGELLTYNLEGTKISRHQILRPDKNTLFAPIPEATGRGAWIARLALGKLDLFDNKGQPTGLNFPVTGEIPFIQLYRFGGAHAIISLTYRKTGRCYLYDQDGRRLTDQPLDAISPIQVLYTSSKNRLTVFTASPNGFQRRIAPLWN